MTLIAQIEPLTLPTYPVGAPEKNPVFFEKRVYQGSSDKVYPVPFIDKVFDEPRPVKYQSVRLENEFVRLVLLPEIGGRILIGQDKTNRDYDFFYRQDVIKPALVGLAGPWISGRVEFNWPQHHRPGTFLPADVSARNMRRMIQFQQEYPALFVIWPRPVAKMEIHPTSVQKGPRPLAQLTPEPGDAPIWQRAVAQLTWAHNVILIQKVYARLLRCAARLCRHHGQRRRVAELLGQASANDGWTGRDFMRRFEGAPDSIGTPRRADADRGGSGAAVERGGGVGSGGVHQPPARHPPPPVHPPKSIPRRTRMNELIPASPAPGGEFLFYQTADGRTRLQVRVQDETVWQSLNQMADLFQRDKSVISRHISNVFEEGNCSAKQLLQILQQFKSKAASR